MSATIFAVGCYVATLVLWRIIYVKRGSIGFWQLVARIPEEAYQWISKQPDWVIFQTDDPRASSFEGAEGWVGPFKLAVPSLGNTVAIFAKTDSIDSSQSTFMKIYAGPRDQPKESWIGWVTLVYPIAAMIYIGRFDAPLILILGYGFASLGYLLLAAGLFFGRFRTLGFNYRIPTLIAGGSALMLGVIFCNL